MVFHVTSVTINLLIENFIVLISKINFFTYAKKRNLANLIIDFGVVDKGVHLALIFFLESKKRILFSLLRNELNECWI